MTAPRDDTNSTGGRTMTTQDSPEATADTLRRAAAEMRLHASAATSGEWCPADVKEADSRILLTERNALMAPSPLRWVVDYLEPLPVKIEAWDPVVAEVEYLVRLAELTALANGGAE